MQCQYERIILNCYVLSQGCVYNLHSLCSIVLKSRDAQDLELHMQYQFLVFLKKVSFLCSYFLQGMEHMMTALVLEQSFYREISIIEQFQIGSLVAKARHTDYSACILQFSLFEMWLSFFIQGIVYFHLHAFNRLSDFHFLSLHGIFDRFL